MQIFDRAESALGRPPELIFKGLTESVRAAKRLFTRAAAELPKLVEADVRKMSAPSPAVWAVIVEDRPV